MDRAEGSASELSGTVDLRRLASPASGAGALSKNPDSPTSQRPRFPDWTNFAAVPVVGLFYLAHVRYRRFSPRRLPTLTSMSVKEVYTYLAATEVVQGVNIELQVQAMRDPDICLIETVARVFRQHFIKPPVEDADRFLEVGGRDALRKIRARTYESATGVLGKLAWWHNHIWSSEETWLRSAAFWEIEFGEVFDFGSIADWDRWLTHLANITQSEPEGENALLYHYADYRVTALTPFVVSIPLAMAARWTGRRSLFRPINGVQRLLLWASIYPSFMKHYQHYTYVRGFENKHQYAQDLRKAFNVDSEGNTLAS